MTVLSNLSKDSRLHSFEDIVYLSLPSPFVFLSTTGPLLIPPPITSSVKSLHRLLKRQKHLIKTFIACRPKCACYVLSRQKFFVSGRFWEFKLLTLFFKHCPIPTHMDEKILFQTSSSTIIFCKIPIAHYSDSKKHHGESSQWRYFFINEGWFIMIILPTSLSTCLNSSSIKPYAFAGFSSSVNKLPPEHNSMTMISFCDLSCWISVLKWDFVVEYNAMDDNSLPVSSVHSYTW